MKRIYGMIAVLFMAVICVGAYIWKIDPDIFKNISINVKPADNQGVKKEEPTEHVEPHENEARSKLTGKWVNASEVNNTPIAVMFSNVKDAMPQSAIGYADIVFESLVEGGITRLCAVFENQPELKKIGPVRSCRTYYLFFAKEFEASYVHFGYSEYAEEYLARKDMHSLEGMVYCDFFRSTDRQAPHNAYTSWSGIMQSVRDKNYPTQYQEGFIPPYVFNEDDENDIEIAEGISCMKFYPGFKDNQPCFEYNTQSKTYDRFQFQKPQTDMETGEQLTYNNILVKYVTGPYWPNGTPNYKIDGVGEGLFITNGKAVEVTWIKDSEYGPTRYYYQNGTEITLNQGKTWVCQIETDKQDLVKISEL